MRLTKGQRLCFTFAFYLSLQLAVQFTQDFCLFVHLVLLCVCGKRDEREKMAELGCESKPVIFVMKSPYKLTIVD